MLVKEKNFYKNFLILWLPVVLQNVISLGVNLADNMMLGRYAEASLSGVTAINQIQFFYQCMLIGIGDGCVIFGAQFWGRKDMDSIKKMTSISMRCALVIMVILFAAVSLFPTQITGIFTNDADIIREGTAYLSIVRFTYPFFCITMMLLAMLRSVENVKIAFYLSVSTLVINCCINYVLIFGNFGFPRLGVRGAAIGTLTARIVEFVILLFYISQKEKVIRVRLRDFLFFDRTMFRNYIRVTAPTFLASSMWGANTAVQTAILGNLSASALSANSMASNLFMIVKTMAQGSATATNVIIGRTIGAGAFRKLRQYTRTFQFIFIVIGITSAVVLFALIEPVLSLYSFSDQSRTYARAFLHILCVVIMGMSYQMPTNGGIVKGGGDTKYIMKLDLISIWCIVIPFSFIMAFVVHASPAAVVWCLNLDQLFKCVPAYLKCNHGRWVYRLSGSSGRQGPYSLADLETMTPETAERSMR